MAVGPGQRVVTVEVGHGAQKTCLVLGVTAQSIHCLHVLGQAAAQQPAPVSFAGAMAQAQEGVQAPQSSSTHADSAFLPRRPLGPQQPPLWRLFVDARRPGANRCAQLADPGGIGQRREQFFRAHSDIAVLYGLVVFARHFVDDDGLYPHRDCAEPAAPGAGYAVFAAQPGDHWSVAVFDLVRDGADAGIGCTKRLTCRTPRTPCSLKRLSKKPKCPCVSSWCAKARQTDYALFARLAKLEPGTQIEDAPFRVVVPAFVISELKTAFQIGFMIFIPFLIIDMVVSSILMSLGMMMLSPVLVALPFKIMLFVLADGWNLMIGSLASSFAISDLKGLCHDAPNGVDLR